MKQENELSPHALLIDLDHCPSNLGEVTQNLDHHSRIIACHGGREPHVPMSLVTALATAIHKGRLELVGMAAGNKSTTEFGLTFWAGRLISEMPEETKFTVISENTRLDNVLKMLRDAGRDAVRIGGNPQPGYHGGKSSRSPLREDLEEAVGEFVAKRLLPSHGRPAKRATLTKVIKGFFKKSDWKGITSSMVVDILKDREYLRITSGNKVVYLPDDRFDEEGEPYFDEYDGDIPF